MVLFHASYDLAYLYGAPLPWFTMGPVQDVWRASISWVFLFLAGWMTSFTRDNLRRAAVYGAAAAGIWLATTWAAVDTPVSFGILFCMAASTFIFAMLKRVFARLPALPAVAVCLLLFGLLWGVPRGTYAVGGLAWLGLPAPGFSSGDYYPIIPFTFMYLAGSFASRAHAERFGGMYPAWMHAKHLPVLAWIGRHSLIIYLAHQPLLIALFSVLPPFGVSPL